MNINDIVVLQSNLISDFIQGNELKIIYLFNFDSNPNKTFVTLDDINHIRTKERQEKRCTVLLNDLLKVI